MEGGEDGTEGERVVAKGEGVTRENAGEMEYGDEAS